MLTAQTIDRDQLVAFDTWVEKGQLYDRYQRFVRYAGTSATLGFHGAAQAGLRKLKAATYTLRIDGKEMATTAPGGADSGEFVIDLRKLANGWHALDIDCAPGETCPRWFMYTGAGPSNVAPLATGSIEVTTRHFTGMLQVGPTPLPYPITPRVCPSFGEPLDRSNLFRENLIPVQSGSGRLNATRDGVHSTFNPQAYFWTHLVAKVPVLPLLDGPRNVGTLMMPTHIQVGHTGSAYFCQSWRVGKVGTDGTITTLAGYRHKRPHPTWGEGTLELVGDWSAIPAERRGFHELWGMAWDLSSVATDKSAPTIDGRAPHVTGPRQFVSDTQNNRICLLSYSRTVAEAPPKVTEFIRGLADPWDVVYADGVIYVSQRMGHKITAHNAQTGALLKTVVQGAALAVVTADRFINRTTDLATIRREQCVGPEGLFVQDGWLYFGSKTMDQVRKVNIATGEMKVVCEDFCDGNSQFVKVALSDGSFGPRGTVFVWSFSIREMGMPLAYLPDGSRWLFSDGGPVSRGKGGKWQSLGYACAGGIAVGRLYCGSSQEGLIQISKALPGDVTIAESRYSDGEKQYTDSGDFVLTAQNGFGHHGLPLPWGKSDAIDYFLAANGHFREAAWRVGQAVGEWREISGSSMNGVNPSPLPAGDPSSRINAWTGLAANPDGILYSPANGGHNDYAGNEVVAIDLREDAPKWKILAPPTPASQVAPEVPFYRDGRPTSSHSYYSCHFVAGRIVRIGTGSAWGPSGGGANALAVFDVETRSWLPGRPDPDVNAMNGMALDAATGSVYFVSHSGIAALRRLNVDGTLESLGQFGPVHTDTLYARPMAFDTKRGRLLSFGINGADKAGYLWDGTKMQRIAFTGLADAFNGVNEFGAQYDARNDRFLVKSQQAGQVFSVHASSFEVTELPVTRGSAIPKPVNGVYGRFVRLNDGFAYYPSYGGNVWFLRTA